METDQAFEQNVPGLGPPERHRPDDAAAGTASATGSSTRSHDKLTGVWRSEVFRDNNGVRTGFADNFYELTLGLIYKPKPWLWIRPEARYDFGRSSATPYNDGTRNSQFTLAIDVILLY